MSDTPHPALLPTGIHDLLPPEAEAEAVEAPVASADGSAAEPADSPEQSEPELGEPAAVGEPDGPEAS